MNLGGNKGSPSCHNNNDDNNNTDGIIIGSDRRPETKQGMGGKIVGFRSGRVRDRVRDKDRRSEPNTVHTDNNRRNSE